MAISLYDASIPGLTHMLGSLSTILAKAEAHGGIDADTARLAPDMLPLKNQIYIATDGAKGCAARLTGTEAPKYEDIETTFPDLRARVAKTISYLKSMERSAFEGSETRDIVLKFPTRTLEFKGSDFLFNFALPNIHFHIATAYDILRNQGVVLGKSDYLGG